MAAPYPPKAIANAFLQRAFNDRKPVSHMQLQKLVYLAHGYYLASSEGVPLINEAFEAWDYGPVCRNLYNSFRSFGRSVINRLAVSDEWEPDTSSPVPAPTHDAGVNKVIDFVYKTYIDKSPFALSDLTHKDGWAWDRTRKSDKFGLKNKDISNDMVMEDFTPHIKMKAV